MHPSDEGTPTPGRPSQTTPNQSGDPNRPRVVGGLDRIDETVAPFTPPAKFPWALSAALVLAIGTGAMLWSGESAEKQIIRAGSEPVLADPPVLPEDEFQEPVMRDVPPPLILREPAKADLAPPEVKRVELRVAEPVRAKQPVAKAKPPKRPAVKKKVKAPPPSKKAAVIQKPEPQSQSERDVALLAAVVTRTKASQAASPVLSVKWKQCAAAKSVAAARQCRAQLCAAGESAAECAGLKRASGKSRP